jgi:hypothetical protein
LINIPQQRVDWQVYDAFEGTDADFVRGIGLSPNNFAQYKRRRLRHARRAAGNGHMPAIPASQPSATPSQPVAVHRSKEIPWVGRGLQVAADMAEAIEAYAREHRLEKREVLDLALRSFFAQVGE